MAVFRLKRWRKSSRTTCAAPLGMRGEVPPGRPESGRATLAIGGIGGHWFWWPRPREKWPLTHDILYFGMYWNVCDIFQWYIAFNSISIC